MLKIVNENGIGRHTHVMNAEGEDLAKQMGISAIEVAIRPGNENKATLSLDLVKLDIDVRRVRWAFSYGLPLAGDIKSIEFIDGRRLNLGEDGNIEVLVPEGLEP